MARAKRAVNLASVDLNLLHVLSVVLEERSATRAGQRLHVTQSAISNALRKARGLFGDPLLLRRPHGLEPTPRALSLEPSLRAWIEGARGLLADRPGFDPSRATRTFRIACSDAVAIALLGPLLGLLGERAPGASLRIVTLDRLLAEDGLVRGEVDLLIGIPPVVPEGHEAETVYRDPMECLVRRGHPSVRKRLSLEAFASLPHVDLALFDRVDDSVDRALARHGLTRKVRVALPHFSSIPLAVASSDCVATVSRRLARSFAQQHRLLVLRPPIDLDPIEVRQVWHCHADLDGSVRFLRGLVAEAARASEPPSRLAKP